MIKQTFTFAGVDRCLWHAWLTETIAEYPLQETFSIAELSLADSVKIRDWASKIAAEYRPDTNAVVWGETDQAGTQLFIRLCSKEDTADGD